MIYNSVLSINFARSSPYCAFSEAVYASSRNLTPPPVMTNISYICVFCKNGTAFSSHKIWTWYIDKNLLCLSYFFALENSTETICFENTLIYFFKVDDTYIPQSLLPNLTSIFICVEVIYLLCFVLLIFFILLLIMLDKLKFIPLLKTWAPSLFLYFDCPL